MTRERLKRRWSQEKLAVLAGVSRTTVARIEQNRAVQRGSLMLVMGALGLQESRRPAANLSDDELIEELERRTAGRRLLQWVADGEDLPLRAEVTRRSDPDGTASLSA